MQSTEPAVAHDEDLVAGARGARELASQGFNIGAGVAAAG